MYIERNIEKSILEAAKEYPIIMVCSQRQVGKPMALNHIKEKTRRYVSFGDRNARRLAETDPTFFETYYISYFSCTVYIFTNLDSN